MVLILSTAKNVADPDAEFYRIYDEDNQEYGWRYICPGGSYTQFADSAFSDMEDFMFTMLSLKRIETKFHKIYLPEDLFEI
jgi:hypothetical protein